MINAPYFYDNVNAYNSLVSPSTVHIKNTGLAQFFKRYLLQDAISTFKWEIPETWDFSYFAYVLYVMGFIAILDTSEFGVIPQHCALTGYNVFYRPRGIIVTNPLIRGQQERTIGVDTVVLRLQPDYLGLYDIVDYYGDFMALAAEAAGVNLLNSKLSFVFGADNKASAESFKELFDRVASGEPAAVVDKDLFDDTGRLRVEMFQQNVGQNFIVDKLLIALRDIRNMFLTEIGIPNANTQKRERLVTDEVNANNVETYSKCGMWLQELKKGCDAVRNMFGAEISVDWRSDPGEGVNNGTDLNNGTVSVRSDDL